MKYFNYFPQIEYEQNQAVNLLVRAKIRELVLENVYTYYSYLVKDSDTPESLSFGVYGSTQFVWLIFYANNIFDPLYDWALNENQFNKYIISKYGSIGNAKSEADEVLLLTLSASGFGDFVVGQQAFQGVSFNNSISRGIVTGWEPTRRQLRLKNVIGDFHPNSGNVIVTGGGVSYPITTRRDLIHHYEITDGDDKGTIIDRKTFLDPIAFIGQDKKAVTFYEYEKRLNESRRNIKIIDSKYVSRITNELKTIFQ